MKNYKILLIFIVFLNLKANNINEDLDYINKKMNETRLAETKFDIKRKKFNNELFLQLELIEKEKEKIKNKLKLNKTILDKIEKEKKIVEQLKKDIILANKNKLVNVYSKMRPRKAAKILEKLFFINKKDTLNIIMKVQEKQLIKILANMKKDNAALITESIDNKKELNYEQ